jgi:hypothetical protein
MFNVMNFKDINNFKIIDINIELCNSIKVFDFMPMTVRDWEIKDINSDFIYDLCTAIKVFDFHL